LNAWFSQHFQAVDAAIRKLAAQRAASVLNILVIGIALSLPAGAYVLLSNLQNVAARFSLEPQLSVFLGSGVKPAERDALERRLKGDPLVAAVKFVPRDVALAELKKTEGIAEVVSALNENPLPDAYVLKLRQAEPQQLEELAATLGKQPGVGHVQADSNWARRLAALIGIGRLGVALLGALLATGMVAVTFNTIRLQVLTQRDEIELASLLGATDSFVRRPFYYLGALQGLAGGGVALGILAGSLWLLNRGVRPVSETYGSTFELAFLAPADATAIAAFAALLGWLGAYLSVSIYLRGMDHSQ
jgi:cell division transport system permease protein